MKFNLTIEVEIDEKKFFTNPDNGDDFRTYICDDDEDLTLQEIVKSTVASDLIFGFTGSMRDAGVLKSALIGFKSRGSHFGWYMETHHQSDASEILERYGVDILQ